MRQHLFIDGKWVSPVNGGTMDVVNPATEEVFAKVAAATSEDVDLAVAAAKNAFKTWSKTTGAERAVILRKIADKIEEKREEIAKIETMDNGKPLPESLADMDDSAGCYRFYADLAEKLDKRQNTPVEDIPDPRFEVRLRYEPVGVVGAIIPFNYPFLMSSWKVAPALAAGCTIVLKPSEYTSLTALELAAIAEEIQLPAGVLNVITGYGQAAGEPLSKHKDVNKLAFTGSVATGTKIATAAAQQVKHVTLELGGKSPFIIFDDADVDQAVEWIMVGFVTNQGQVCSATTRLLLQEGIAPKIISKLKDSLSKLTIGSGLEEGVNFGPIVSAPQYQRVLNYIKKAKEEGATLEYGGEKPKTIQKGYFVEPTIFTGVAPENTIWKEEIFGPVLAVRTFKEAEEALNLANDSEYGLAAAVMSSDPAKCQLFAERLESGIMYINCSQPCFTQAPWGGVKRSGVGRELGQFGLDNYLSVKQVCTYKGYDQQIPFGYYNK